MGALPQLVVSTLLLGGIYALIAVGLTLIFGIMRVVNFAHGEFLMLGMYLAFWAFALWHLDPYVVLVIALPVFFAVGLLSYWLVMQGVIKARNTRAEMTPCMRASLRFIVLLPFSGLCDNLRRMVQDGAGRFSFPRVARHLLRRQGHRHAAPSVCATFGPRDAGLLLRFMRHDVVHNLGAEM